MYALWKFRQKSVKSVMDSRKGCWEKRLYVLFQGWVDVRLEGSEGDMGLSRQHRRLSSHFHELPARQIRFSTPPERR